MSALPYEKVYHMFKVPVDGPYEFHILYISQKCSHDSLRVQGRVLKVHEDRFPAKGNKME